MTIVERQELKEALDTINARFEAAEQRERERDKRERQRDEVINAIGRDMASVKGMARLAAASIPVIAVIVTASVAIIGWFMK